MRRVVVSKKRDLFLDAVIVKSEDDLAKFKENTRKKFGRKFISFETLPYKKEIIKALPKNFVLRVFKRKWDFSVTNKLSAGQGVTVHRPTYSIPATVLEVTPTGRFATIQYDLYAATLHDCYLIKSNPRGKKTKIGYRINGEWRTCDRGELVTMERTVKTP